MDITLDLVLQRSLIGRTHRVAERIAIGEMIDDAICHKWSAPSQLDPLPRDVQHLRWGQLVHACPSRSPVSLSASTPQALSETASYSLILDASYSCFAERPSWKQLFERSKQ